MCYLEIPTRRLDWSRRARGASGFVTVSQALGTLTESMSLRPTFLSAVRDNPSVATSLQREVSIAFVTRMFVADLPNRCDSILALSEDFMRVKHAFSGRMASR
jgi:hypothetical protein